MSGRILGPDDRPVKVQTDAPDLPFQRRAGRGLGVDVHYIELRPGELVGSLGRNFQQHDVGLSVHQEGALDRDGVSRVVDYQIQVFGGLGEAVIGGDHNRVFAAVGIIRDPGEAARNVGSGRAKGRH
jgi:hypothetical protein